jgi:predicted ATPase/transcriptional regulator with XRE-family HTH domain
MAGTTGQDFGAQVRRYRQAANLTQEELAERAGVSVRGLKYLEQGARRPFPDTVRRLAAALPLSAAEQAAFAALAAPPSRAGEGTPTRTNLPAPLTSFIGRGSEIAMLRGLLGPRRMAQAQADGDPVADPCRLLTLTGPGGCGKTRLAMQVAADLRADFPDGVWLVELAPLATPALVPQAVAAVLGVREESGRPLPAILAGAMHAKRLLLVLDNCEHQVLACAELADSLLRTCARLQILVTSQEPLGIAGERTWKVPSLSVPDSRQPASMDRVLDSEAVQLFVERVRAVRPAFTLSARNADLVGQVCRRLDGIPLALELAAARLSAISLEALATRLDDRFRLLTGGSRTALPRRQTLRATLDWSYALLSETEQALLRRLAVFAGGWTLDAAEAVCTGEDIDVGAVLDLMAGLVNKSLVMLDEAEDPEGLGGRYHLLETVRHYAREHLTATGEEPALRKRHADCYLALAERAEPALEGPGQREWLDRLEADLDNLRAALCWAREGGQGIYGLRLSGAMRQFWVKHDHWSEGRRWLEEFLVLSAGAGPAEASMRARALSWVARLAFLQLDNAVVAGLAAQSVALCRELGDPAGLAEALYACGLAPGDFRQGAACLEESLALRRELGDRRGLADSLYALANLTLRLGNPERALPAAEESLALYRELDHAWDIAGSLWLLGEVARALGNLGQATSLGEESLALFRDLREKRGIAIALWLLGEIMREQGDLGRAAALGEESLAVARDLGSGGSVGWALSGLGLAAAEQGDPRRAGALLAESLTFLQATGGNRGVACGLAGLAGVAYRLGQAQRAARLAGASAALFAHLGAVLPRSERAMYERTVADTRAALGDGVFAAAWGEGWAMTPEESVACALAAQPA